jgi:hypothetical protein
VFKYYYYLLALICSAYYTYSRPRKLA